ncbi:hypothetical protein [Haloferula sargassicola]|uniref:hypothetical protein n=1 Tax=Haloferula sargassicola TaxID=490096 RepID=UPI0033658778
MQTRRDACNARFKVARRRWPRLDADDFSRFLIAQVSPLALALQHLPSGQAVGALDDAYELGLQLVAEKLAGPAAATPAINSLWTGVFPELSPLIATAPRRIMAALCNAAHQLDSTPDTDAESWRERLVKLGPRCTTADELLIAVPLLAWRAGLAHFREPALRAADGLPKELALEAVGAPVDKTWHEVRDAYLADPWFTFEKHDSTRKVGAFRGYGGLFVTPPRVSRSGPHLLVRSGDEAWILLADAFGATFHRAAPDEISAAEPSPDPVDDFGRLPPGHLVTSSAAAGGTCAVTSAQSHAIWIGPHPEKR